MSFCEEFGKDKVVFVSRQDALAAAASEPKIQLSELSDDYNRGLILPNGDINFNCPCLGGMASGPCGYEFRDAFSCFHYSTEAVKGSECVDKFMEMQSCMSRYPNLYADENRSMDVDPGESMVPDDQQDYGRSGAVAMVSAASDDVAASKVTTTTTTTTTPKV